MNASSIIHQNSPKHRTTFGQKRKRALYEKSGVIWRPENRDPKFDWGPITNEKYKKLEQIGVGTYGNVFKAEAPSGKHVALKMVRTESEKEGFPITAIREIKILKSLDHPNIVPLMDVVTSTEHDRKDSRIDIVFDYMEHDLSGLVKNPEIDFQEKHVKHFLQEILKGLKYCHEECNVLHRDIKGSNVLVNNRGQVKLADFGLARIFKENEAYTNKVVTLWYRAPELLLGETKYGPAIDMWSVGCVFAEMIFKTPPFQGETELDQITEICKVCGSPDEESWPRYAKLPIKIQKNYPRQIKQHYTKLKQQSPLAFDLLDRLLVLNPDKRLTASQALNHDYFHKEPLPAPADTLISCQPSTEFKTRKRKAEAKSRSQQAARKLKEENGNRFPRRSENRDFHQVDYYDGGYHQDDPHSRKPNYGMQSGGGRQNHERQRRGSYDGRH